MPEEVVAPVTETSAPVQAAPETKPTFQVTHNSPTSIAATEPSKVEVTPDGTMQEVKPIADTPVIEENQSTFTIPDFNETAATEETPAPATPVTSWKDAIKTVDKKELYKELGLNDFAIELNEHLLRGGNAADYIAAKAVNWENVSDADIVMSELKRDFPDANSMQLQRLYNKKYNQTETAEEEDKEDGMLLMKADARKLRQSKIAEQQSFKIPEPIKVEQPQSGISEQERQAQAQQAEQLLQFYVNHDATKNLMTSKSVAIDLGDAGSFNFKVDKPEFIMQALTDGSTLKRLTTNDKGEPNIKLLQEIVLYAMNPKQFVNDLFNYGSSKGMKTLVEEGQNAKRPVGTQATPQKETPKEAWGRAVLTGK